MKCYKPAMWGDVMIREATLSDINEIAELHISSYENHFLPKLGPKLLSKYYKEFLEEENIFIVDVDEESGRINGFVLGTPNSTIGKKRFINNNKIWLLLKLMLLCLKLDKDTWTRVFKFATSAIGLDRSKRAASSDDRPNLKTLGILSICVVNQCKGQGIAKILVEDFEQRLIKNGYEGYTLSVYKTNERARRFYEKISMKIYKESAATVSYIKELAR